MKRLHKYCLSCYYICIRNYNERVAITAYTYISASYLRYAFNQRVIKKQIRVCEEISVNNQIFYDNELAEGLF